MHGLLEFVHLLLDIDPSLLMEKSPLVDVRIALKSLFLSDQKNAKF